MVFNGCAVELTGWSVAGSVRGPTVVSTPRAASTPAGVVGPQPVKVSSGTHLLFRQLRQLPQSDALLHDELCALLQAVAITSTRRRLGTTTPLVWRFSLYTPWGLRVLAQGTCARVAGPPGDAETTFALMCELYAFTRWPMDGAVVFGRLLGDSRITRGLDRLLEFA